jgi:CrcB protein
MSSAPSAFQAGAVFLGAGIGGVIRWAVSVAMKPSSAEAFPVHTFTVNLVGSFLIGLVFFILQSKNASPTWQLFAVTGILGGFTTFSAFSIEALLLMQKGKAALGIGYLLGSCILGLLLAWGGLQLGERLTSSS